MIIGSVALVAAVWIAQLQRPAGLILPNWTYLITSPGMTIYSVFAGMSASLRDGWFPNVVVVGVSAVHWICSLALARQYVGGRYAHRATIASPVSFARKSLSPTLALFVLVTMMVAMIVMALLTARLLLRDLSFLVGPGGVLNLLTPGGPFSGEWAALPVAIYAGMFWACVACLIDWSIIRVVRRVTRARAVV